MWYGHFQVPSHSILEHSFESLSYAKMLINLPVNAWVFKKQGWWQLKCLLSLVLYAYNFLSHRGYAMKFLNYFYCIKALSVQH